MYISFFDGMKDNIDIEKTLRYNDLSLTMLNTIELTVSIAIEFWGYLKSVFNISKVNDSAVKISKNIKIIKDIYDELFNKLNYQNLRLLLLYYYFLNKILFNELNCKEIEDKIIQFNQNRENFNNNIGTKVTSMTDLIVENHKIGTIVISGNLKDLGKIISVNQIFIQMFLFQDKNELLNKLINIIIPYYISQFHESFIKRYFNTAKKNILDKDRLLFGLKSTGFIFPIILHTKIIPNLDQSIRFIGYMSGIKKSHKFYKTRILSPNYKVFFMICNNDGFVFGISKSACLEFGIPLNVMLNAKINSDQTKTLNIKFLFPETDFLDPVITQKLISDEGLITVLDTRRLNDFFEDFKETCIEVNKINEIFKTDYKDKFTTYKVQVFMTIEKINNNKLIIKTLKIINLDTKSESESNLMNYHHKNLNSENNLKDSITNEYQTIFRKKTLKIDSKILRLKYDVNKSKNKIVDFKYPKKVKVFLLFIILFLLIIVIISFLDMYFKIMKFNKISIFFNVWVPFLKKNIYFTDMILCLNSMLLIQNGFYANFSNTNALTLLINKFNYDLNKSILLVNNLTFNLRSLDTNLTQLFINETFNTINGISETNNTYSFESMDLNVRASLISSQNFNLVFDNLNLLFDYNSTINKNESTFTLNYLNLNNNSLSNYRIYTEKINEYFKYMLDNSDFISFSKPSYFPISGLFISIVAFIILSKILSKLSNYKIKILKIFFVIDKKWADIIIKRCKKYLDFYENYLICKEKDEKSSFINFHNDDFDDPKLPLKRTKKMSEKRKSVLISKNNINLEEKNSGLNNDENSLETMKSLISKFTKKRWILNFKLIVLIFFISAFFIETIIYFYIYNPLSTEKVIIHQIADRGWSYNNLEIFYRSMIMQGHKKRANILDYTNSALLYNIDNLDSFDLFNLYFTKISTIESIIQTNLNAESRLLSHFFNSELSLSSSLFCSILRDYDNQFYNDYQSDCEIFNNGGNKVGIKNLIAYSTNYFYNKYHTNFNISYNFDMKTIKSIISDDELSIINDTNFLYLNQAFILLLENFLTDISIYISKYINYLIVNFNIILIIIITEFIVYLMISNSLKNKINKDKSILSIIPSEAIISNEKMTKEFQRLNLN